MLMRFYGRGSSEEPHLSPLDFQGVAADVNEVFQPTYLQPIPSAKAPHPTLTAGWTTPSAPLHKKSFQPSLLVSLKKK